MKTIIPRFDEKHYVTNKNYRNRYYNRMDYPKLLKFLTIPEQI